jgi:hypothetical protein
MAPMASRKFPVLSTRRLTLRAATATMAGNYNTRDQNLPSRRVTSDAVIPSLL